MSGAELLPIVTDAAGKTGAPLGEAIGGTLSDVWMGVIGDRVANWRLKNIMAQHAPLKAIEQERGVTLNLEQIPERFAYSWFDKASQEDEPEIQALFAKLLANAAEGNDEALKRRNIELISKMSPSDARLLQYIAKNYESWKHPESSSTGPYLTDYSEFWHAAERDVPNLDETSFETLMAHRIIEEESSSRLDGNALAGFLKNYDGNAITGFYGYNNGIIVTSSLILTATGQSLIKAVFPEEKRPD